MEWLRARLSVPATLVVVALFLGSCSHVLKTSEMSPLLSRSPLRDLTPKTFAFKEFKDIRGAEDPTELMKIGVHTFALEDPPAVLVAQWVNREFERNGHRCVPYSPEAKADFLVEGTVFKFSVRREIGWVSATEIAETAVKLTISRVPTETGSLAKSYQGLSSFTTGFTISIDSWKSVVHQALMAMIQDLSTDSELVTFLGP